MTNALGRILTLSCLLLCAIWVTAQTYPSQGSTQPSQTTSNEETSVQGCLSGTNGNYTLTDSTGNSYQLAGDTSKLSKHVGHKVEVTGTTNTASTNAGNEPGAPSSSRMSTQPTLNI